MKHTSTGPSFRMANIMWDRVELGKKVAQGYWWRMGPIWGSREYGQITLFIPKFWTYRCMYVCVSYFPCMNLYYWFRHSVERVFIFWRCISMTIHSLSRLFIFIFKTRANRFKNCVFIFVYSTLLQIWQVSTLIRHLESRWNPLSRWCTWWMTIRRTGFRLVVIMVNCILCNVPMKRINFILVNTFGHRSKYQRHYAATMPPLCRHYAATMPPLCRLYAATMLPPCRH